MAARRWFLSGAFTSAALLLAGCATSTGGDARMYRDEIALRVEEISITRTTRTDYTAGATLACAAAPFPSASEQRYEMWSVETRRADGRLVSTHERRTGEFSACFGAVANGALAMYATWHVGTLSFTSLGECRFMKSKPPAAKLLVLNCNGDIAGLPDEYVGGYMTASSLAPSGGKEAAHVPGYLSTSVITTRLWRKPPG